MKYEFDFNKAKVLYDIFSKNANEIYVDDKEYPRDVHIEKDDDDPFEYINPGPISSQYWLHIYMEDGKELWFEVYREVEI